LRNIGEVFGVFGHVNLTASGEDAGKLFESTVRLKNLHELEQWVADLKAPKWPDDFGPIDQAKAEQGRVAYERTCSGCHALPPYPMTPKEENQFGKQFIVVNMIPVEQIGTDPRAIENMLGWKVKTGNLAPLFGGAAEMPAPAVLVAATQGAFKRLAAEQGLTEDEIDAYRGYRLPAQSPPNLKAYKARPLAGIWSTAPYFHNGSAPNLYEVILPPGQRSASFYVGSRSFDPKHVGFVTDQAEGTSLLDTSLPGNRNTGHPFGEGLSDEERWAVVEFLKTL